MRLDEEIAAYITSGSDDLSVFNALALRLFAYQYANNAPYQRFCNGRGKTPQTVADWREIPAVPASAFKRFVLSCVPESACERVFHSSGTTSSETSHHYMDSAALQLYKISLEGGYKRALSTAPYGIAAVMPPPEEAPHSSLSFMLGELVQARGMQFFWGDDLIDDLRKELRCTPYPFVLFGTAFAFVHFFDATEGERFVLPEGSVVIETGGFKGRSREVSREELYALFVERLGVEPTRCYSEYGMSELASQFYSVGVDGPKLAPPWLKTRILDPVTGNDAESGTPGLLAHYDLANYNSVLAIQTEDLGLWHPSGGFTLLGRAPGAVLRGCSLTAESLLEH